MAVGGNVEVKGLSRFTSVNNLYVSGTITTSGSMQLGKTLVDGDSDLILSSSSTSQITISGNLKVLNYISGNLTPNKSNAHTLGDDTFYWHRLYIENLGSNNGGVWIKNTDEFQHGLAGGTVGGDMQVNLGTKLGEGASATSITVYDNATLGIGTYGGVSFEFAKVGMERLGSEFRYSIPIAFTTGANIDGTLEAGFDIESAGVMKVTDGSTGYGAIKGTWLGMVERSSDPSDPPEGESVIWQSDGTGTGDDGDIMLKITAGSTTKTVTLVDFSAS